MSQYIECDKCHLFAVEVIGDKELGCEHCLEVNEYFKEDDDN